MLADHAWTHSINELSYLIVGLPTAGLAFFGMRKAGRADRAAQQINEAVNKRPKGELTLYDLVVETREEVRDHKVQTAEQFRGLYMEVPKIYHTIDGLADKVDALNTEEPDELDT